jgi:WD40 repeat protein
MNKRKCHHDWVTQVQYFEEMNSYVSCSADSQGALTIGDLGRRTCRKINVPGGVKCFNFCRRPSFLVTGGRDKIVRLWNPYVLSKPAGSLDGHTAAITQIVINHEESHIISLAEDKVIKVWSARSLTCLQTVVDTIPHRPENIISSIFYDSSYRKLITGSDKLETWPVSAF